MDVLEVRGELARYQLKPVTGQRHQLRVHMLALGLPIMGDGLYPVLTPEGHMDYAQPLQLLAKTLAFDDPVMGNARQFTSQRTLNF
jgi:tRNA pseudouridine32 synthase/23S rRNA pseudouridine746 synthase